MATDRVDAALVAISRAETHLLRTEVQLDQTRARLAQIEARLAEIEAALDLTGSYDEGAQEAFLTHSAPRAAERTGQQRMFGLLSDDEREELIRAGESVPLPPAAPCSLPDPSYGPGF